MSNECVNSLFQLSVSSTPALNQTHKKPTCKAACMRGELDHEVPAVKQGWDPSRWGQLAQG